MLIANHRASKVEPEHYKDDLEENPLLGNTQHTPAHVPPTETNNIFNLWGLLGPKNTTGIPQRIAHPLVMILQDEEVDGVNIAYLNQQSKLQTADQPHLDYFYQHFRPYRGSRNHRFCE